MSTWTHVVGVIRFDSLPGMPEPNCGSTCEYEDDESIWDKCTVPCGSEGSLQISKWENPASCSIARYTYSIFGDLRHYENGQEIIDYFNKIVKGQNIRQAFFSFYIGGGGTRSFVYDNKGEFVEVIR